MNRINRKIIFVLGLCCAFAFFTGCQDTREAVRYNDSMVAIQNDIIVKFLDFTKDMANMDSAKAQSERLKVVKQIDEGIQKEQQLKFDGDDKQFKQTFMELLRFYKRVVDKDYEELIALLFRENQTEEDIDKINAYVDRFSKEEVEYDLKFSRVQKQFVAAYNLRAKENRLQKEIDNIN